jgi:hypothetical protein
VEPLGLTRCTGPPSRVSRIASRADTARDPDPPRTTCAHDCYPRLPTATHGGLGLSAQICSEHVNCRLDRLATYEHLNAHKPTCHATLVGGRRGRREVPSVGAVRFWSDRRSFRGCATSGASPALRRCRGDWRSSAQPARRHRVVEVSYADRRMGGWLPGGGGQRGTVSRDECRQINTAPSWTRSPAYAAVRCTLRATRTERTSDHAANARIRRYRSTKVMRTSWKSQTLRRPSATTSCARGANA